MGVTETSEKLRMMVTRGRRVIMTDGTLRQMAGLRCSATEEGRQPKNVNGLVDWLAEEGGISQCKGQLAEIGNLERLMVESRVIQVGD